MPPMSRTWSVIGAGSAGTAVAALLVRRGDPVVAIWSRRRSRARYAQELIGEGRVAASAAEAARAADFLLIAVPDAAITGVALGLHRAQALEAGQTLIHLSGALPAAALKVRAGLRLGAMHPIQTIPTAEDGILRLPGSFFGIEGSPGMLSVLGAIVLQLGGLPLRVPVEGKPLYHAAMAMASNHVTALASVSSEMLVKAGLAKAQVFQALLPLMRGTVEALARQGLPKALTGPVARGDAGIVAAHLAALQAKAPDLLPIYVTCARQALRLARAKGLGVKQVRELDRILPQ